MSIQFLSIQFWSKQVFRISLIIFNCILVCLLFQKVYAEVPKEFNQVKCLDSFKKVVLDHKKDKDWRKAFAQRPYSQAFKGPSNKLGSWILVRKMDSGIADILVLNPDGALKYSFDHKCKLKKENLKSMDKKTVKSSLKPFTDKDLAELVASKKKAVVYVWSPGMVFSYKHLDELKKMAQHMKYDFVSLLSSDSTEQSGKKAALSTGISWRENSRRVASNELEQRDVSVHQPAVIFIMNSKIHPRTFTGVRHKGDWKNIFMQMESELL